MRRVLVVLVVVTACSRLIELRDVTYDPMCNDQRQNGSETDVDCGGSCGGCAVGQACVAAQDCTSLSCQGLVCQAARCGDGIKNGDETGADCGGSCAACDAGGPCDVPADCTSGVCAAGLCQAASCSDRVKNGDETGVDCGGSCAACDTGGPCDVPADCTSGVCTAGQCQAASCSDRVRNGDETDQDCGGSCAACGDGAACGAMADCASGVCTGRVCQAASCSDDVQNGSETDVDCGGGGCVPCPAGRKCKVDRDCAAAGVCDGEAPLCRAARSCSEIKLRFPATDDGVYTIAPAGGSFPAVCDMRTAGGGWTLLLKAVGDATFAYAMPAWTDDSVVNADDLTTQPGNAKYPSFLTLPITALRGDLDGFPFTQDVALQTAQQLFAGRDLTVMGFPTFNTGAPNWSAQPNCHTFGINIPYPSRARFGWSANQENDCLTNDTAIGLGINGRGAGYLCGSTLCSAGNVDAAGTGLLWGR